MRLPASERLSAWAGRPALAWFIAAGLGLWCVHGLAMLAWTMLFPSAPPGALPVQSLTVRSLSPQDTVSVANLPLFGDPVGVVAAPVGGGPETQLALTLIGTIAGKDPRLGVALIADDKGQQGYFQPGAQVAGARLEAVHVDHVELLVQGRREVLRLARPEGVMARRDTPAAAAKPADPELARADEIARRNGIGSIGPVAMNPIDVSSIRQALVEDPAKLLANLSVVPVAGEQGMIGVRISAPGYEKVLSDAGLKPDDLIVSVNGIRIDSPDRGLQIAHLLRQADRVSVIVRRDGREIPLPALTLR